MERFEKTIIETITWNERDRSFYRPILIYSKKRLLYRKKIKYYISGFGFLTPNKDNSTLFDTYENALNAAYEVVQSTFNLKVHALHKQIVDKHNKILNG